MNIRIGGLFPQRTYLEMTSSIVGRSLGLDLHVNFISRLKPRPLPNRNLRVRFRLQLFKSFPNTCSHFRMQVLPCGYFYEHRWVSVPFITCLPPVPPMNALSRWTFVHRLARADRGWGSTNPNAPAAKPPSFEHPSLRCL